MGKMSNEHCRRLEDNAYDLYLACKAMADFLYAYSESNERVSSEWYPKFKEKYSQGFQAIAKVEKLTPEECKELHFTPEDEMEARNTNKEEY